MGTFFAKSLKRQYAYANSAAIRLLDRGPLQCLKGKMMLSQKAKVKTATTYTDKKGVKRFQGTKALKSKTLGLLWNICVF